MKEINSLTRNAIRGFISGKYTEEAIKNATEDAFDGDIILSIAVIAKDMYNNKKSSESPIERDAEEDIANIWNNYLMGTRHSSNTYGKMLNALVKLHPHKEQGVEGTSEWCSIKNIMPRILVLYIREVSGIFTVNSSSLGYKTYSLMVDFLKIYYPEVIRQTPIVSKRLTLVERKRLLEEAGN